MCAAFWDWCWYSGECGWSSSAPLPIPLLPSARAAENPWCLLRPCEPIRGQLLSITPVKQRAGARCVSALGERWLTHCLLYARFCTWKASRWHEEDYATVIFHWQDAPSLRIYIAHVASMARGPSSRNVSHSLISYGWHTSPIELLWFCNMKSIGYSIQYLMTQLSRYDHWNEDMGWLWKWYILPTCVNETWSIPLRITLLGSFFYEYYFCNFVISIESSIMMLYLNYWALGIDKWML